MAELEVTDRLEAVGQQPAAAVAGVADAAAAAAQPGDQGGAERVREEHGQVGPLPPQAGGGDGPRPAQRLAVEDFGPRANGTGAGDGYGLAGMRERAELLGGRLSTAPTPCGFRVELWIPA